MMTKHDAWFMNDWLMMLNHWLSMTTKHDADSSSLSMVSHFRSVSMLNTGWYRSINHQLTSCINHAKLISFNHRTPVKPLIQVNLVVKLVFYGQSTPVFVATTNHRRSVSEAWSPCCHKPCFAPWRAEKPCWTNGRSDEKWWFWREAMVNSG